MESVAVVAALDIDKYNVFAWGPNTSLKCFLQVPTLFVNLPLRDTHPSSLFLKKKTFYSGKDPPCVSAVLPS